MHRSIPLLAIALCVFLPACDDNDTTAPSAAPVVFSAQLSPSNEVPPVGGVESAGHGAVQVQFDVTRDASGTITAATGTFYFQLTGYPPGTTVVGAHIHPAPAGINGPVVISTGISCSAASSQTRLSCSRSSTTLPRSTSTCTRRTTRAAFRADSSPGFNRFSGFRGFSRF